MIEMMSNMLPFGPPPKPIELDEAMREVLKQVEEAAPEDRLGVVLLLRKEVFTINIVLGAWTHWLSNLEVLDLVQKEELTKMVQDFYDILEILMLPSTFLSTKIKEKADGIFNDTSKEEPDGEMSIV